jgi:hypothetical protein
MIRKNSTHRKIDQLSSSQRRYLRKLEARKHNEEYVPFTLDPGEYTWDKSHKKCRGTGILGTTLKTDKSGEKPILCGCVRRRKHEAKDS